MKGCVGPFRAPSIHVALHLSFDLEQGLTNFGVPILSCEVQRKGAILRAGGHLGSSLNQSLHNLQLARPRGEVQWRALQVVGLVHATRIG